MEKTLTYKLFPKQFEFLKSDKKECLYSGAMGAGKSFALCCKLVQQAMVPDSFCVLTRKTLSSLKSSTLRTLLIGEKDCPPVLPRGSYEYSESRSIISIFGGGSIFICGCDDPVRLRSVNASCVAIDEASQLNEDEYIELKNRIRNSASFNRQIFACTNPASQNHFLYKRFFRDNDGSRDNIIATLKDNHHLTKDYVDEQMKLNGISFRRYVMAEWCNNEGGVFRCINPDITFVEKDINNYKTFIFSCDIGFNDPTAILVGGYDDDSIHIFDEICNNTLTPTDICKKLDDLGKLHENNKIVIDKSAKGIILQAEQLGLRPVGSNSDIEGGINRMREMFIRGKLTISSGCENLIKELDMYSYKDGTDKPEDKYNHSIDSCRYLTNLWFDSKSNNIIPHFSGEEETKDPVDSLNQPIPELEECFNDDDNLFND